METCCFHKNILDVHILSQQEKKPTKPVGCTIFCPIPRLLNSILYRLFIQIPLLIQQSNVHRIILHAEEIRKDAE